MRAEDQAVIDAAREWIVERAAKDPAEKALALAVLKAFPEDIHTRETCGCEDADECDECLPVSAIPAILKSLEPQPLT